MELLIGLLIGLLVMWLIAGFIVYAQATPLNKWFQDEHKVTALTILTWPQTTSKVMRAGLEHEESQALKPRPNPQ